MILCVDDEPNGLRIREMLLRSQGYQVLTATSGREGLELFASNPISLVVLDYLMPEMDGGEVAAVMKQLKPEVKILLFSAYIDLPAAAGEWVDSLAVKGTAPEQFLQTIQQLLSSAEVDARSS
ncbi:MAG: response regulator [Candidatus Korobacteraceae bacterium]